MKNLKKIKPSEVTPLRIWQRRRLLKGISSLSIAGASLTPSPISLAGENTFEGLKKSPVFSTKEGVTDFQSASTYNNFYEFGTDKSDPYKFAYQLETRPWTVEVHGEVKKSKQYDIDDLLKVAPLEERIYRLRCVEGWSMVIPWVGYQLSKLIKTVELTGNAKFVEFTTVYRPEQMPGQKREVLKWPYVEGMRLDEAINPLTLLTFGMYGKILPNQNGSPVRVVVPWKYGFKSAKSLVSIKFTESQPKTAWMLAAPNEYGFYSNVNPDVSHPRWSQRMERRIGEFRKRKTLIFNGYADHVAHLYNGMDLKRYF